MNHKQNALEWLITMSKQEAFKAHAWHRAQELDKQELFAGIAKELEAHMLKLKEQRLKNGG